MSENNVYEYKLVLLGDQAVGKTSIVIRFIKGSYDEYIDSTIGAAFFTQTLSISNYSVKFEIWDTAGQERYEALAPMYYRGAGAAIIVYDITKEETFQRAEFWVNQLKKHMGDENEKNKNDKSESDKILICLVGNKVDLDHQRQVSRAAAEKYANDNNLLFIETSAKNNINIKEIFSKIAKKLPKNKKHKEVLELDGNNENVFLNDTNDKCKCNII